MYIDRYMAAMGKRTTSHSCTEAVTQSAKYIEDTVCIYVGNQQ
jgi:hypothetical protein